LARFWTPDRRTKESAVEGRQTNMDYKRMKWGNGWVISENQKLTKTYKNLQIQRGLFQNRLGLLENRCGILMFF
jgi:hypothetical protein